MNEQLQKLILGAQNAYTRGRFDDQAQFANQALGVDHTSQSAATLFFVAQWHIQEFDFAARFLLEFIGKNGASQASIACGLFAMLQAKWNNVDVVNHAAVFLGSLKEDDIRSRYARDAAASFQIRTREPLSERTSVVAPSIRDTFGPTGRIKSLRPADVSRHWDTALFYILEDINVRPREWYVFDDEHIYLDDTLRSVELLNNPQIMRTVQSPTIIATSPKLPARLGEVMGQVMGIQWHRGTQWAYDQARAFRDEIRHRADNQMWACPNEQYRLMYVGQGLWQNLDFFTEFEEKYGAVFVRSNYLSIASDGYIRYGARDPIRALASRYVTMSEQMHIPGLGSAWAIDEARTHRVDGGLSIAGWWGVKTVNQALEEAGIPVLDFPVDAVDGNTWDDAKMRALVSRFIEDRVAPSKARKAF